MALINHFLSPLGAKVSSEIDNNKTSVSLDDLVGEAFNFSSCQIKHLLFTAT
jgi:hypothetical protein